MNGLDLLLFIILLLLIVYIYQTREYLPAESEQENKKEAIKTKYCAPGEEKKCTKDSLCIGNDIECNKLCISGSSEPIEPGIRKCL
jgi:hypothetical protein